MNVEHYGANFIALSGRQKLSLFYPPLRWYFTFPRVKIAKGRILNELWYLITSMKFLKRETWENWKTNIKNNTINIVIKISTLCSVEIIYRVGFSLFYGFNSYEILVEPQKLLYHHKTTTNVCRSFVSKWSAVFGYTV